MSLLPFMRLFLNCIISVVDAKESSKVVGTLNVSVECVAGLTAVHRDLQGAGMESLYP